MIHRTTHPMLSVRDFRKLVVRTNTRRRKRVSRSR
jgi:hypothetical protein